MRYVGEKISYVDNWSRRNLCQRQYVSRSALDRLIVIAGLKRFPCSGDFPPPTFETFVLTQDVMFPVRLVDTKSAAGLCSPTGTETRSAFACGDRH